MNRRDLLKRIAGIVPCAAILPVASAINVKPQSAHGETLKGWKLLWTGWKDFPNGDMLAGQWLAYPNTVANRHEYAGWMLFSSWPGSSGAYVSNQIFDLALRKDQILPTKDRSESELEWMKNECLERLRRMIAKVGPPPFDYIAFRDRGGVL